MGIRHTSMVAGLMVGLFTSAVLCGCGGGTTYTYDGPTGKVTGTVSFKGQPVTEGQIVFTSVRGAASADIGEDGAYSLAYMGGADIPVGSYKVTVAPPRPDPATLTATGEEGELPATIQHPMIPEKYQLSRDSDLTASVKEGENPLNFDMQ